MNLWKVNNMAKAKIGATFHDMGAKQLKNLGQSNDRIKHVMAFRELQTRQAKLEYIHTNRESIDKHFGDVDKLIESWKSGDNV
jgi:HD superfamily phosphodiesterase